MTERGTPMLSEELVIVRDWLRELSGLDLEDVVADSGITAGMVVQHEARGMAARLDRALDAAREEGRQSPRPLPVGVEEIAAERRRQVEVEGWTPEHDDEHADGALARAAAAYAFVGSMRERRAPPHATKPYYWPWAASWWKPKDSRSDLVRAGALIVAEIERLDRLAALSPPSDGGGA